MTACRAFQDYLLLRYALRHAKFAGQDKDELLRQFLRRQLLPKSKRSVSDRCLVDMLNGMGFDVEAFISQEP